MRRFDSLRPCPCCGCAPVALVQREGDAYTVRVECSACHVSTPGIVYARRGHYDAPRRMIDLGIALDMRAAREKAAAIWDRRPE